MPRPKPRAVVLLPARDATDTAPPASPWQLVLRRLVVLASVLVPVLIEVAVEMVQRGEIRLPPAWVPLATGAIVAYHLTVKKLKEADSAEDAKRLQAMGLPVGRPLSAEKVKDALYSDAKLPVETPPPPRRSP